MVLVTRFINGVKRFTDIGPVFSIIEKHTSPEEFKRSAEIKWGKDEKEWNPKCFAFIIYNDSRNMDSLDSGFDNYIMSDSKLTFMELN